MFLFVLLLCTDAFSQISQSINNPLADDQTASPGGPPPASCRQTKWVFVNGTNVLQSYLRAPSTALKSLLHSSSKLYLDFFDFFVKGAVFTQARENIGQCEATHSLCSGTVHLHGVTGVKITNQRMVIEPLGWETFWSLWRSNQESTGRIQSLCFS